MLDDCINIQINKKKENEEKTLPLPIINYSKLKRYAALQDDMEKEEIEEILEIIKIDDRTQKKKQYCNDQCARVIFNICESQKKLKEEELILEEEIRNTNIEVENISNKSKTVEEYDKEHCVNQQIEIEI